jgi:poly-gamma-glutamate synthesis protein (capsule biosynthesis protein)
MVSPPVIADELKWAGVDMVAGANNHAFDYGSTGVIETVEHAERAGLALAGIGPDLQAARAPAFFRSQTGTTALVSMAATFVPYGRASSARPDMRGRPGLNPLRLTKRLVATITPTAASNLFRRRKRHPVPGDIAKFLGLRLLVGNETSFEFFRRGVHRPDLDGNLDAIRRASRQADVTVASIHAHRQEGWLPRFAHQAIDHGADVVFVQGPHEVRAIELHAGKPIFYSMGDFVYQPHRITRFPSEMYDMHGLGPDATVKDLWPIWAKSMGLSSKRKTFEAFCTVLDFGGGRLDRIRLLPLDLQFEAGAEVRGRPRLADAALGRKIIEEVAALSRKRGATIRYDADRNEGIVELPRN